jgi:hypothetical protein
MLNNYSNLRFLTVLIFMIFFIPTVLIWFFPAHAVSNLTVIPQNSSPFGKPFSNWTADWWKWYIETPFDNKHQSKDPTGSNCGINQSGPVWFLSGSELFPSEKTCVIPGGKAILSSILVVECSYVENKHKKSPEELRGCANQITNDMNGLKLKYDGINIHEDKIRQDFRTSTSPFIVNFPDKNVFAAKPPGNSTSVSDGYWIMFEAPPPGNYDLVYGGCYGSPIISDPAKFCQDITYHLKVLPS